MIWRLQYVRTVANHIALFGYFAFLVLLFHLFSAGRKKKMDFDLGGTSQEQVLKICDRNKSPILTDGVYPDVN